MPIIPHSQYMMETYISLVQTHAGKDKLLRAAGYICSLLAASDPRYAALSRLITQCRSCLRVFDDAVVLRKTCKWAVEESDYLSRVLTILSNLSMQAYLPLDHLALLTDLKVISSKVNYKPFSMTFLSLTLFLSSLKNIRKLFLLLHEFSPVSNHRCRKEMANEVLLLVKNLLDVITIVSALPWEHFLWAGSAQPIRNAKLGLISSVASILALLLPYL